MSLTRVHNLSISLDGFATGEPQSFEAPFGHAGQRLHKWMIATRFWDPGGTAGVDDAVAQMHSVHIGAEIMGANKFGPPGWHDDPEWTGWWGPNLLFHTPTFVLTHHPRPPLGMEGGTTFHFLDATPAEALTTARAAADGLDVRAGLAAAVAAAEQGMKDTIPLQARKGRASYLGERSIGHQDPGATSSYLILNALLEVL